MEHKKKDELGGTNKKEQRLYIVTHNELSIECQTVQVAHATANFVLKHPVEAAKWQCLSNTLVVLEVENAEQLVMLYQTARNSEIDVTCFREIDLCDELTAIAFMPSKPTSKMLCKLPLFGNSPKLQKPLIAREKTLFDLSKKMIACDQVKKGHNTLKHGSLVRDHYFLLLDHLHGSITLRNPIIWKLPSWFEENRTQILTSLPCPFVMDRYLTLHGCASLQKTSEKGEFVFAHNPEASKDIYLNIVAGEYKNTSQNQQIAYLIAHDMDMLTENVKLDSPFFTTGFAMAQILACLANITANASLTGGLETKSCKVQLKRIETRGLMYFEYLKSQSQNTTTI